jgi:hypothetical protein
LRQADQARTDFALIEEHLEFLAGPAREGAGAGVPMPIAIARQDRNLGVKAALLLIR